MYLNELIHLNKKIEYCMYIYITAHTTQVDTAYLKAMHAQFHSSHIGHLLFDRLNVRFPKFCGLPDTHESVPVWVAIRAFGSITPWVCIGYYGQHDTDAVQHICPEQLPCDLTTLNDAQDSDVQSFGAQDFSAEDLERYNAILQGDDYSAMLFYVKIDEKEYGCVYDPRIIMNDCINTTPMAIMQRSGELDLYAYDAMDNE